MPVKKRIKHGERNWSNEVFVRVYQLAREGMSDHQISKILGVRRTTFNRWLKRKPGLKEAIEEGRKGDKLDKRLAFRDYVFGKLPPKLQRLWQDINIDEDASLDAHEKAIAILRQAPRRALQRLFLHAIVTGLFSVHGACAKLGLSHATPAKWARQDAGFAQLMVEVQTFKKDFLETAFWKLVDNGDTNAILYGCKALLRDRGFNDKVQLDINIKSKHVGVVRLEDLPLEARRAYLEVVRRKALPPPDKTDDDAIDVEYEEKE